jgi:molecular chaperone GrpE
VSEEADASEQGDEVFEDQSRRIEEHEVGAGAALGPDEIHEAVEPAEDTVEILEDRLRRALADLDNLRKRYLREVERERFTERMDAARQWLPVVDDLERALEHLAVAEENDRRAIIEGIRVVRDRALAVLAQLGFPRFDATGEAFDPTRHEAVSVVDSDAPPGTVVGTVRPGYGAGEIVLRPAAVVVARAGVPSDGGAETQGWS